MPLIPPQVNKGYIYFHISLAYDKKGEKEKAAGYLRGFLNFIYRRAPDAGSFRYARRWLDIGVFLVDSPSRVG